MNEYVSVDDIVKRYTFHAMEKAEKEISQILYEVKKHNEDMIPASVLEDIKAEIEYLKMHRAKYLTDENELCISALDVLEIIDKYMDSCISARGKND